ISSRQRASPSAMPMRSRCGFTPRPRRAGPRNRQRPHSPSNPALGRSGNQGSIMRSAFAVILVASLAGAGPAAAATPITLLYTAGDYFTETYVAKDQGFFSKHGLDVTLQGDEQGLDLVIVASANRNPIQPPVSETGIAARSGSGIKSASDLVGKKV